MWSVVCGVLCVECYVWSGMCISMWGVYGEYCVGSGVCVVVLGEWCMCSSVWGVVCGECCVWSVMCGVLCVEWYVY